ncbi:MAG: PilN domain-containing protein [Verrucomicrobiota bacterium]|jgi:Tfp pilus assembly protein PilN|nr:PilN domain-containing protein [Verrucomicrobiota bacterium]
MGNSWITGVCVRADGLEWTVLRRGKESWETVAHGRAALAPAEDGLPAWDASVLKPYLKQFRGRISIALPGDRVLFRMALLPSTDAEELRGMAELQTDKFSPFPMDTISESAEVLSASDSSSLVAMAVVQRDVVDEIGGPFQELGALPDAVDVEPLGWWWCLKQMEALPTHGSQIILRVADFGVDMMMVRDGELLQIRSLPALPPPAEDGAFQSEWVEECIGEIGYSLTTLETEWGGAEAISLHVFSEPGKTAAWAEDVQKALGLEAVFTHSLAELPTASEGIARRLAEPADILPMDLAPEEWRAADAERRLKRRFLRSATLFLVVWLLLLGLFLSLLNLQRGRQTSLSARVDAVEAPAREIRRLRTKVLEFAQYADRTHSALECLRVVAEAMPPGMELSSFAYRKGSSLSLRADSNASDKVYTFVQTLERSDLFTEVRSEGITTRNTPQGTRYQFSVVLLLPGAEEEES